MTTLIIADAEEVEYRLCIRVYSHADAGLIPSIDGSERIAFSGSSPVLLPSFNFSRELGRIPLNRSVVLPCVKLEICTWKYVHAASTARLHSVCKACSHASAGSQAADTNSFSPTPAGLVCCKPVVTSPKGCCPFRGRVG